MSDLPYFLVVSTICSSQKALKGNGLSQLEVNADMLWIYLRVE